MATFMENILRSGPNPDVSGAARALMQASNDLTKAYMRPGELLKAELKDREERKRQAKADAIQDELMGWKRAEFERITDKEQRAADFAKAVSDPGSAVYDTRGLDTVNQWAAGEAEHIGNLVPTDAEAWNKAILAERAGGAAVDPSKYGVADTSGVMDPKRLESLYMDEAVQPRADRKKVAKYITKQGLKYRQDPSDTTAILKQVIGEKGEPTFYEKEDYKAKLSTLKDIAKGKSGSSTSGGGTSNKYTKDITREDIREQVGGLDLSPAVIRWFNRNDEDAATKALTKLRDEYGVPFKDGMKIIGNSIDRGLLTDDKVNPDTLKEERDKYLKGKGVTKQQQAARDVLLGGGTSANTTTAAEDPVKAANLAIAKYFPKLYSKSLERVDKGSPATEEMKVLAGEGATGGLLDKYVGLDKVQEDDLVDPLFGTKAQQEYEGDPDAFNASTYVDTVMPAEGYKVDGTYAGYGSFGKEAYADIADKMGGMTYEEYKKNKDPKIGKKAILEYAKVNSTKLEKAGVEPTNTNVAMAHNLGAGNAARIIKRDAAGTLDKKDKFLLLNQTPYAAMDLPKIPKGEKGEGQLDWGKIKDMPESELDKYNPMERYKEHYFRFTNSEGNSAGKEQPTTTTKGKKLTANIDGHTVQYDAVKPWNEKVQEGIANNEFSYNSVPKGLFDKHISELEHTIGTYYADKNRPIVGGKKPEAVIKAEKEHEKLTGEKAEQSRDKFVRRLQTELIDPASAFIGPAAGIQTVKAGQFQKAFKEGKKLFDKVAKDPLPGQKLLPDFNIGKSVVDPKAKIVTDKLGSRTNESIVSAAKNRSTSNRVKIIDNEMTAVENQLQRITSKKGRRSAKDNILKNKLEERLLLLEEQLNSIK